MRRLAVLFLLCATTVSAQTKKVVVMGMSPENVKELQAVAPEAKVVAVTKETVMEEIRDADGFIGSITPEMVRAGKKLQWSQINSAGVERVLHLSGGNDLRDSNIILTNNQIVQGPEIGDHAFGMLLMFTRRLNVYWENKKQELWQRGATFDGIELKGKNALVIGVGGIGTQIAFRAWAFGMNVVGVDPEDIPYMPIISKVVKPDQLDQELPQADVVFVAAPHTPMTYKMMGARQFGLMKKNSYFIAVSRGPLYDMDALVKALAENRLAAAGVDVTDPEPLPKGHPLWKFDNVIITPHIAGRSEYDAARMFATVKENLRRFVDGKPLINVVDKKKGY
jgi:phosphoglycerate dehydrogenase-like enzyme